MMTIESPCKWAIPARTVTAPARELPPSSPASSRSPDRMVGAHDRNVGEPDTSNPEVIS